MSIPQGEARCLMADIVAVASQPEAPALGAIDAINDKMATAALDGIRLILECDRCGSGFNVTKDNELYPSWQNLCDGPVDVALKRNNRLGQALLQIDTSRLADPKPQSDCKKEVWSKTNARVANTVGASRSSPRGLCRPSSRPSCGWLAHQVHRT